MKVVDASIVYKWYVPERETGKALDALEEFRHGIESLAAPDLVLYELASALRHNPGIKPEDIESILENFVSLRLEIIVPSLSILKDAVRLALRHGVTVYDAVYVALARSLGCDFVTADKKLQRKLASLPFVHPV
ncbi:MAG: type II toxin-antitoxin system VapC family toxin [Elusimicrobia bacterium]|nr:type II toxin-antitoxin system VapC family toxin [Elusimicrobiota bacterium]